MKKILIDHIESKMTDMGINFVKAVLRSLPRGLVMIASERIEQLEFHGYDAAHDEKHKASELIAAAMFAITLQTHYKQDGWERFEAKMWDKSQTERLAVAGALIAAEIDRIEAEEANKTP